MHHKIIQRKHLRTLIGILLLLLGLVCPTQALLAATANAEALNSNQVGLTDPRELEIFLDEIISKKMKEDHIPGVAISVVKDGKIYLAKGYGYANINKKVPVDPAKTVC